MSKRQRVVLVTGSTRGIGLAIARKFHNNGDIIIQNGRNQASNAEILQNFELGDVSSKAQSRAIIDSVIKKFGAIDILICNVGNGSQAESYISVLQCKKLRIKMIPPIFQKYFLKPKYTIH